eukprot:4776895-Pyramimonas_sp.AAC.1
MTLSTRVWGREAGGDERGKRGAWARTDGRVEVPEEELKRREAEARASQTKMSGDGLEGCEIEEGRARQVPAGGAEALRRWKAGPRGPSSRRVVDMNEKQREVVEK